MPAEPFQNLAVVFISSPNHSDVLIRADVGVEQVGADTRHLHSKYGPDRTRQQKKLRFAKMRTQVFRDLDAVRGELFQADCSTATRTHPRESFARTALIPLHNCEMVLPRAQMGSKDGITTARAAMDDKKNRVALVLSPDRDPLVDAADLDETRFDNASRSLDLQTGRYLRLSQLSVNEKNCGWTRNQEEQGQAN
jgi:hypothetical protein